MPFGYHDSGMYVKPLKDRLNSLIFKNNDFFFFSKLVLKANVETGQWSNRNIFMNVDLFAAVSER